MKTSFRLVPLSREIIDPLVGLSDAALAEKGIRRMTMEADSPVPCRVSLTDSKAGESVFLLSVTHLAANSPYHSSGPVFVRENAVQADLSPGEVPKEFRARFLSVRAYDADDMMVDSAVTEGRLVSGQIERLLTDESVAYLHLHNASPGCFACRVERA